MTKGCLPSFFPLVASVFLLAGHTAYAEEDPGKQEVATLVVRAYYATDGEVPDLGKNAKQLAVGQERQLRKQEHLRFKNYREIGCDMQPVWRSYQNWAMPLRPSKEIMVSFEPLSCHGGGTLRLDLDYWQGKRKVAKFNPSLRMGGHYYILGPTWKNGRLILAISVSKLSD